MALLDTHCGQAATSSSRGRVQKRLTLANVSPKILVTLLWSVPPPGPTHTAQGDTPRPQSVHNTAPRCRQSRARLPSLAHQVSSCSRVHSWPWLPPTVHGGAYKSATRRACREIPLLWWESVADGKMRSDESRTFCFHCRAISPLLKLLQKSVYRVLNHVQTSRDCTSTAALSA